MHEDLIRLRDMDTHDRAAAKAARAAQALRDARSQAEKAVADAEAHVATLEDEGQALRKEELTAQRGLEQARTYRDRANRALQQGLGDADAAQRQLEQTTEQIDDLETQLLEHMESGDDLAQRKQKAAAAVDATRAALAELLTTYDDILGRHEGVSAEESRRVSDLATGLPAELRTRYEDQRAKRRWAVAVINGGACNACNQVVRQQHISDLRRGLLKPCMNCSRFLVVVDED